VRFAQAGDYSPQGRRKNHRKQEDARALNKTKTAQFREIVANFLCGVQYIVLLFREICSERRKINQKMARRRAGIVWPPGE
jgi:hypothetical protein